MHQDGERVDRSPAEGSLGPGEQGGQLEPAERVPIFRQGVAGALVVTAISVLIVAGLWVLAREAPSAGSDPRLQPVVPAVGSPGRFEEQIYATFVPDVGPRPGAAGTPESER